MTSRPPWLHSNGSNSSSLAGMEIGIPPGQTIEQLLEDSTFPPPAALGVHTYGTKPLPPVPARRSFASSLNLELSNAFKPPKRSVDYQNHRFDLEQGGTSISVILDTPPPANQHDLSRNHRQLPKLGTTKSPSVPPDEILSPQPRTSVQKILRLTSSSKPIKPIGSPIARSPTGHNSPHKIQQLMGLDTAGGHFDMTSRGPHRFSHPEVSPVSPLSSSSTYSTEDLEATISEPDDDLGYTKSSRISWAPESPSSVPPALNIHKAHHRLCEPVPVNPVESHHSQQQQAIRYQEQLNHHRREGSIEGELYHATAAEIARNTQDAPSKQYGGATAGPLQPQHYGHRTPSTTSTSSSLSFLMPGRRKDSFSDRVHQSRVRVAPPAPVRTGAASAEPFGTGKHPLKTPYPPQQNVSVFESDTEDEEDSEPSALAKIFKRRSGVVEIIGPTSSSSPAASSAAAALASAGQALGGVPAPPSTPAPPPQERVVLTNRPRKADSPDTPMPPGSMLQRTGDQLHGLMARAKESAGFVSKSEKKRESLKSKIKVLNEGGGERSATPSAASNGIVGEKWV